MNTIPPPSDTTGKARPPHGCGTCPARWSGLRIAHCRACHETFTTPANFDRHRAGQKSPHRPGGECYPPADSGLVLNERGQWAMPGRDD